MTLEEFYKAMLSELPALAEKSFYDHIEIDEGQELYPPFIFVHETNGTPFNADDTVYYIGVENVIDVYTADRSTEVRKQISDFLTGQSIGYSLTLDSFDDETMLYVDRFTIELDS